MPRRCCICQSAGKVRYNELPSEPALREKWLSIIPDKDKLGENPVVCDSHFHESDYLPSCKVRRLKRGVIPKILHDDNITEQLLEKQEEVRDTNLSDSKKVRLTLKEVGNSFRILEKRSRDVEERAENMDFSLQESHFIPRYPSRSMKHGADPSTVGNQENSIELVVQEGDREKSSSLSKKEKLKGKGSTTKAAKSKLKEVEDLAKNLKPHYFRESSHRTYSSSRSLKPSIGHVVLPNNENMVEPQEEEADQERYLHPSSEDMEDRTVELEAGNLSTMSGENLIESDKLVRGQVGIQTENVTYQSKLPEEPHQESLMQSLLCERNDLELKCIFQETELKMKNKKIQDLQERLLKAENLCKERAEAVSDMSKEKEENQTNETELILNRSSHLEDIDQIFMEENLIDIYQKNIAQMIENRSTHRKAAFLLDQIRLYNMKVPQFADTTILECLMWEDSDPSGYQYARQSELLTLPSTATLKKYLDPLPDEGLRVHSCDEIESTLVSENNMEDLVTAVLMTNSGRTVDL